MQILITGTTYYPGLNGQAIFTVNLAEGLVKRGHQVTMVFPSEEGRPYSRQRNGVRLEAIRSIRLTSIHPDSFVPLISPKRIRQIFDAAQPEIVHIQDHYPLSHAVARQTLKRGIHVIGTNHFMPENLAPYLPGLSGIKPIFNWMLWKWMLGLYNQMVLVSAKSRDAARLVRS